MLTQARIDQFYRDVESLGLTKKVADIQRATKFPKSNISEWLNKKKKPSEKFVDAFYDSFYNGSTEISSKPAAITNGILAGEKPRSSTDAYMKLLEDNDRFFKTEYHNLLVSLKELVAQGQRSERLLKLNLQHVGIVEALQKGVEEDEVQAQIGNQIAGIGEDE